MKKNIDLDNNYWVYILECSDKSLYTGIAKDPYARLKQHNSGKGAKYTASRRPCKLVYLEKSTDRTEAQKREYTIKQLSRSEKLNLIGANQESDSYVLTPKS